MTDLFMHKSALFSGCRKYRYVLERIWGDDSHLANFLMLNPSTADEDANDPTVERQCRRVSQWGFGGLIVTNAFAWRSTDPNQLLKVHDPIGVENDRHILEQAKRAAIVVCGWGSHKAVSLGRGPAILKMLADNGIQPHALRISNGNPWHPLYIGYDARPIKINAEVLR